MSSILNRIYQGFVNSPMIEALSSSSVYRSVKERFGYLFAQIPFDQIFTQTGCTLQEGIQKVDSEIPKLFKESILSDLDQQQCGQFLERATFTPLIEQAIFQGLIQDLLLTRLPRSLLPRYERPAVDETLNRIFRVVITAGAYTAYQLYNAGRDGKVGDQLIWTLAGGLLYSTIKETNLGIIGSGITQIALNSLFHYPNLEICSPSKS